ncbi:transposable element, partial [Tanacetum coccineum]
TNSMKWKDIVDEFCSKPNGKSIWSVVTRLTLAAAVYLLWKERNGRIFRDREMTWLMLLEKIMETVKMKLLGLKVKQSPATNEVDRVWEIKLQTVHAQNEVKRPATIDLSSDSELKPQKQAGKKEAVVTKEVKRPATIDLSGTSSKRKRKRTPVKDKDSDTVKYDERLVGKKVKVWWPEDKMYYEGVIESFDAAQEKHKESDTIKYDKRLVKRPATIDSSSDSDLKQQKQAGKKAVVTKEVKHTGKKAVFLKEVKLPATIDSSSDSDLKPQNKLERRRMMEENVQGVLPVARELGEGVLWKSAEKLKPYLMQAVTALGDPLDTYTEIVTSVCGGTTAMKIILSCPGLRSGFVSGHKLPPLLDYEETYSPVVDATTLKFLISLANVERLQMRLMDVVTVYLYGSLDSDIYMKILEGLKMPKACKSKPREISKTGFTIIAVYVDDSNIIGNLDEIEHTANLLKNKFEIKDLGITKFCLGLVIEHLSNGIFVHQSNYTDKIPKKFNMDKAHLPSSPMVGLSLDQELDPFHPKEHDEGILGPEIPYLSGLSL